MTHDSSDPSIYVSHDPLTHGPLCCRAAVKPLPMGKSRGLISMYLYRDCHSWVLIFCSEFTILNLSSCGNTIGIILAMNCQIVPGFCGYLTTCSGIEFVIQFSVYIFIKLNNSRYTASEQKYLHTTKTV